MALLLTAEEWRFVEVWDVATGKKVARLTGPPGSEEIFGIGFGPTGKTLAIGGHATSGARRLGYAHVWSLERRSSPGKGLGPQAAAASGRPGGPDPDLPGVGGAGRRSGVRA